MITNRNSTAGPVVIIGLLVAVLVVIGVVFGIRNATHVETLHDCKVTDKDRTSVSDGNGGSKSDARVYTDSCGVVRVGDSLLSWTFSSSDTYAEIEVGKTYDFKTRGYRVPFLSMFPNVVEVTEVTP